MCQLRTHLSRFLENRSRPCRDCHNTRISFWAFRMNTITTFADSISFFQHRSRYYVSERWSNNVTLLAQKNSVHKLVTVRWRNRNDISKCLCTSYLRKHYEAFRSQYCARQQPLSAYIRHQQWSLCLRPRLVPLFRTVRFSILCKARGTTEILFISWVKSAD